MVQAITLNTIFSQPQNKDVEGVGEGMFVGGYKEKHWNK